MQSSSHPQFVLPISRPVMRFGENEPCEVRSVDSTLELTDDDLETIVNICNEKLIYNRLFKERFNGEIYSLVHAERFSTWAREGWQRNEWFMFLIRNSEKRIIGAIDIKSAMMDEAEIGYWASSGSPGIMTNTAIELCHVAKEAGYLRLYALIARDNEKSIRVVLKAQFVQDGEVERDGKHYLKFTKTL